MSNPWEFQDGGVDREPRGGANRTPAYVHYNDIIPSNCFDDEVGIDIIIDTGYPTPTVSTRVTNSDGDTIQRV